MKTYDQVNNFNKLVRDNIPEIIKADGKIPKTRILDDEEYRLELLKKIVEEAKEVFETGGEIKELVKEIGDVQEVIDYLIKAYGLDKNEIEKIKKQRKEKRGGFDKKIFLKSTE